LESVEPHTVLIGFQPRTQAEMAPPGERRLAHTDPAGLVVERKRAGPLRLELPPPGRDPSLPPANASGGAPRQHHRHPARRRMDYPDPTELLQQPCMPCGRGRERPGACPGCGAQCALHLLQWNTVLWRKVLIHF